MLERLPRSKKVGSRVKALLRAEVSMRDASAARVAKRLGMSVRTLSRKLDEESTSYRALIDETRRQLAVRDLTQTARPITEIAYQLGFASSQSFQRAFRRWTGTTASAYRAGARKRQR
jgi:AraC-like DNA-binding protein